MKSFAKNIVANILGWQIRQLRKKNNFKVVAVTGSIGKTSTKMAIAQILSRSMKVRYQDGNYNDIVSVPLIFFGQELPSLFNPFEWLRIFWSNQQQLKRKYPYDVVIVELGTDAPGQIGEFSRYLHNDIAVITAITPEHMEFFPDLLAVAREELSVVNFSNNLLINADLCDDKYTKKISAQLTYGVNEEANYRLKNLKFHGDEASFDFVKNNSKIFSGERGFITEPQLYSICAGVAVALELGVDIGEIKKGIHQIKAVNGRMNRLSGINNSVIIDDSYNASPEAVKAALDTLYRLKSPQKIAVLGNMNELGKFSENEHKKIGYYCNPKYLDLVVTIGPDANKYLAPAAESEGCSVATFDSPYVAGNYLKPLIKNGAIILIKGSQNRVYAEETTKILLANPEDKSRLVRQSSDWLKIKNKAFR